MFSFNKSTVPAVAALLLALTLPAGALAEEAAGSAAKDPLKEASEVAKEQQQKALSHQSQHPANIAVLRVNGAVITKLDMDRALKVMLAQSQVKQPLAPEAQKEAESAVLEQLTSVELLYQEAAKLEIPDLDKQVNDKVSLNRAKFKTDEEFIEALKSVDMTMQDMQDFTRKDIVINNFIEQKFTAKAAATDAEAKKFYEENKDQYFKQPEAVRASHILVGADEKATPEERKRAKERAEALLKRVKAGEDFAAIAKAESSCPSASQGGDLGAFGHGEMVPAFEKAAFALKKGEVSGVVESEFGYHIIKVTDKQEAGAEKFENVKDKITDFLKRQKVQQEVSSLVDTLRKTAKIEKE
ncbi:peptidylprolyl isomerase [Geomonas sp. Red69]|uniref:peptidylprolyl isomerase n=1 Tax=Geomonas diazotrophica TaxID=2843197 RepID=UPI001C102E28|nr:MULTISPECIES: peptidylprolyl isomerase [Geomonas]MBU5636401.1 peptidylprolyl isomerase [Geomonas diazotrophica]QXE88275.1 peptidylprolyl isomerase [Geomonas nitrogeniifigens]